VLSAKIGRGIHLFLQWWLTSDQILFRRFLGHESLISSLLISIGINLWGLLVLYVPINFLIPRDTIIRFRDYLKKKFPPIKHHLERTNQVSKEFENGHLGLLKSKEKRDRAISDLIETYEYDYIAIFALSCIPIPFLGTVMTGGAIFAVEALEIRYGLFVIVLGKLVKVFALAAIAYFAHFL
jgi:hypothetical protein